MTILSAITGLWVHAVAMYTRRRGHARSHRRRRSFWESWTTGIVVMTSLIAMLGGGLYTNIAAAPGYAPWQDKVSTVMRQIGFGAMMDAVENWIYTSRVPSDSPPDVRGLLASADGTHTSTHAYPYLPPLPVTADGRGWHPLIRTTGEQPMVYTALLQPDQRHRSIVVGTALLRSSAVHAHLMPGTAEPPATGSAGRIPPADSPNVVAAFNSGFKMSAHPGGFFLDGKAVRELVDGKASAVIDDQGRMTIGQWGRDVAMSPHVRAVRQNLALIVENGRPVPGLDRNTDLRWGSARNQLQYTWRSGLGVTSRGDVVYLAGDRLNLSTLGAALAQAGAMTGMELDIHSGLQFFSAWRDDGSGRLRPQRLLPTMVGPAERYLHPDARDFFYFTTTGAAGNPPR